MLDCWKGFMHCGKVFTLFVRRAVATNVYCHTFGNLSHLFLSLWKVLFASLPNTRKSRRANTTGSPFHVVNQCFSTGVPRVVARGSAETDRIRLGRSSRPQFYAVVAISTLGSLHRVPWATQTFAEASAAAKRLKNTAVNVLARRAL